MLPLLLHRGLCLGGLILLTLLGAQRSSAQPVAADSQQLRPSRIEQIQRRIETIRRTPMQWRRRVAPQSPTGASPPQPSSRRAPRSPDGLTRADLGRLEQRIRTVVNRVLADALTARVPGEQLRAPRPRLAPPETVRVATPVPDTVTVELEPDSVRVARDTLREIRVEQVERRLLDTGVFRAFEVNFAFAASTLQPRATRTLDAVGTVLQRYPDLRLEIAGHTDSVGPDAFNQRLSEARARAVRTYLIDRFDLTPDRLVARGYGEAQPVASNEARWGRALNRRVEFTVLNPEAMP